MVEKLALLARDCGLDGIVCSALEAARIREIIGNNFYLVTPGIRLVNSSVDDQMRIATPREAIKNGANYLVVGRPISQSTDPLSMLQHLNNEVEA